MNPIAVRALIILTLINLLNFMDRYVLSALVEALKASELALSDTQCGMLMTGFVIVFMLVSPAFGYLGDRGNRPRLLAIGVALWSVATALGGIATGFGGLFVARAFVGVGEAAYIAIAPALLSDYFRPAVRARVYAVFFSAIPVGSALGFILGGIVEKHYGWRSAFFVAGVPGILLAALALIIRDPPRGGMEEEVVSKVGEAPATVAPSHPRGFRPMEVLRSYGALLENRPYGYAIWGYAAYTFGLGGLAFWCPAFLERMRGMSRAEASIQFGAVVVVTGFVGTFLGGWFGDKLYKKRKDAQMLLSGVCTLLAVPFLLIALNAHSMPLLWGSMVIAELFLFASTGPINAVIIGLCRPFERAAGMALANFIGHLFGDVPSPPLIGVISDHSTLSVGIQIVPVAVFVSAVLWLMGARRQRLTDANLPAPTPPR